MANLTTTADLKAAALQHAGELTNGNSPFDSLIVEYINRTYNDVIGGGNIFVPDQGDPWPWAKAQTPGVFALLPPFDSGQVTLTNASVSGTFSVAPSASLGSLVGRFLKMAGKADFYRIATHTSASTAFTIDLAWQETTGGYDFEAHKLDYALTPGIMRLIEPIRVYKTQTIEGDGEGRIQGTSPEALARDYPRFQLESGVPTRFAQIGEVDGAFTLRFNKSVVEATRVEYEYIPVPTALTASPDTTPLIPREHRSLLAYGAAYFLMLDKEDPRADAFFRTTQSKLQSMFYERRRELSRLTSQSGRMIPRVEYTKQNRLRTRSGLEF